MTDEPIPFIDLTTSHRELELTTRQQDRVISAIGAWAHVRAA